MVEWLNQSLEIGTVIWLFPIIFMLHDFEEIFTVESWLNKNKATMYNLLPARLQSFHGFFERRFPIKTAQFSVAVAWIFLLLSAITLFTVQSLPDGGSFLVVYIAALHILFVNVFTHVGQAILYRGYTPGVITAIALLFPYSLYTYYRLLLEGYIDWQVIWTAFPLSIVLLLLIVPGLILGRKVIP